MSHTVPAIEWFRLGEMLFLGEPNTNVVAEVDAMDWQLNRKPTVVENIETVFKRGELGNNILLGKKQK